MVQRNRTITAVLFILLACFYSLSSFAQKTPVIAREDADKAMSRPITYNGRVCPLNTLARDFAQKVTGSTSYKGLTPEQLILSIPLAPEQWAGKELILIRDTQLCDSLHITNPLARMRDFYTADSVYLLTTLLDQEKAKPLLEQNQELIQAINEADELLSLISMNIRGKLIVPYNGSDCPSNLLISAEILYNKIPIINILIILFFMSLVIWTICDLKSN